MQEEESFEKKKVQEGAWEKRTPETKSGADARYTIRRTQPDERSRWLAL
jgi:hypothetical protein